MKFEWKLIFDNSKLGSRYWEGTWRAKVIGGWLVRHEICNNYDYEDELEEEGWKDINNTMTFISDPDHKWEIDVD